MEVAPPLPPPLSKLTSKCAAEEEQADFLAIDDLLDFSNDDIELPIQAPSSDLTLPAPASVAFDRQLSAQPCGFDSNSLCVPCDDLAELEWLSNFVEESDAPACFGDFAAHSDAGDDDKATHRCGGGDEAFRTTSPVSVLEASAFSREKHGSPFSFTQDMPSVPGRARSKRCRTAVCFWNTRILCPEVSESLLETASTPYAIATTSSESDMYNSYYDYGNGDEELSNDDSDDDTPFLRFQPSQGAKDASTKVKNSCNSKEKGYMKQHAIPKPKKMKLDDPAPVRKCVHCATHKTPQWRAGPMGPKTLCNACGVRYKSGRLCEEYRPAASPTFIESVHSNSHRKVLEMRRQRGDIGSNGNESHKLHKSNGHRLKWGTSGTSGSSGVMEAEVDIDGSASAPLEDNKEDTYA